MAAHIFVDEVKERGHLVAAAGSLAPLTAVLTNEVYERHGVLRGVAAPRAGAGRSRGPRPSPRPGPVIAEFDDTHPSDREPSGVSVEAVALLTATAQQ